MYTNIHSNILPCRKRQNFRCNANFYDFRLQCKNCDFVCVISLRCQTSPVELHWTVFYVDFVVMSPHEVQQSKRPYLRSNKLYVKNAFIECFCGRTNMTFKKTNTIHQSNHSRDVFNAWIPTHFMLLPWTINWIFLFFVD